ncbi:MAG TPA: GGDEF domain-containing protein [Gammaproteobacteria bacterium]|nr:GGDEF domain-containing protein [Gammaproteobacteria bacterium]
MRVTKPETLMNKPLHNIASSFNAPSASADDPIVRELTAQRAMSITQSLQTSLDPTRLIEVFSIEVGALIVHQGVRYQNDDLELDVKLGRQAPHSCTYNLNIGDEPLGKLTFRRDRKFNKTEIESLEQLLCSLLYPLRNALLYQDALQLAQKDPLTGIYNRAALDDMMQRELSHARRQDSSYALLILDIDHFKAVNDKYGHIIGDCALKAVANMIGTCKRDGDLLFRYGGEEFVVLMRDTDFDGSKLLAERICTFIEASPCTCSGADLDIKVSIGVSVLQENDSPISLFARADQALYSAKRNGRNQVCVAEPTE